MGAWEGPDDQPGTDQSLAALNALVPATEELDLLDQHSQQVARAEREETYRQDAARLDADATLPATADEEIEDLATQADTGASGFSTLGQAIGFLHHVLGAEVVEGVEGVEDDPGPAGPRR